jgi:hypothetical protein
MLLQYSLWRVTIAVRHRLLHPTILLARKFCFRLAVLFLLMYVEAARPILYSQIEALEIYI